MCQNVLWLSPLNHWTDRISDLLNLTFSTDRLVRLVISIEVCFVSNNAHRIIFVVEQCYRLVLESMV